ncbi:MAG: PHP domain-containing protein, partial [Christensenellaceae bacterium]|nr:PHP domain-containing protein [Christensenellaceae bacterium]
MNNSFQKFNNADMHLHTNFSDGSLSPYNLIRLAYTNNVELVSITDHDTVNGIIDLNNNKIEGENYIYLLAGVELSTNYSEDSHVLGYGDNLFNYSFATHFEKLKKGRLNRESIIIDKLKKLGINITSEQIKGTNDNQSGGKQTVGRVHIAKTLIKYGYVDSIDEAFNKYLADGRPAYVERPLHSIKETVELLSQNNVFPVLAHPKLIGLNINKLYFIIKELKYCGLEGIEVYHPSANEDYQKQLRAIADEFNLVCTSGSDYHYTEDNLFPGSMIPSWGENMFSDISKTMERMYKLGVQAKKYYFAV